MSEILLLVLLAGDLLQAAGGSNPPTSTAIGVIMLLFATGATAFSWGAYRAQFKADVEIGEDGDIKFAEVCLVAAQVKDEYAVDHAESDGVGVGDGEGEGEGEGDSEGRPTVSVDFNEGVDAVLGGLIGMGWGDSAESLQLATLVAGDHVDLRLGDVEELDGRGVLEFTNELYGPGSDDYEYDYADSEAEL